jgi:hypothetical protein
LRETQPKAVRNNVYPYPAAIYEDNGEGSSTGQQRDRRITSWKMTEHMYFKAREIFPTLARGLFTEAMEEGDEVPPGLVGLPPREIWEEDSCQSDSGQETSNQSGNVEEVESGSTNFRPGNGEKGHRMMGKGSGMEEGDGKRVKPEVDGVSEQAAAVASTVKRKRMRKVGETRERIVARGYDKFFNVDEAPWTSVSISLPSENES